MALQRRVALVSLTVAVTTVISISSVGGQGAAPVGGRVTDKLTAELLRKMLRVEPAIMRIANASIGQRTFSGAEPGLTVEAAAARLEENPAIQGLLRQNGLTAGEFLGTVEATIRAVLAIDMISRGQVPDGLSATMRMNIDLLGAPPDDLVEPLDQWKSRRMESSLRDLRGGQ